MLYLRIVQGRLNHEFFVKWISVFFCNQLYHKKLKIFHVFQTNHDQKKIMSKKKSVRSGNTRRLITTTRRQEKGKKEIWLSFHLKRKNTQICCSRLISRPSWASSHCCTAYWTSVRRSVPTHHNPFSSSEAVYIVEVRPQRVRQTN